MARTSDTAAGTGDLHDSEGAQKPRYHLVEAQNTEEYKAAWPVMPHRVVPELPKKSERTDDMWTARNRRAQRQKPLSPRPSPYDSIFPNDMKPDD